LSLCSILAVSPTAKGYAPPRAWRQGNPHPELLQVAPWRAVLARDWSHLPQEVWIYPLSAEGGRPLRPTTQAPPSLIAEELGITLSLSGALIDIDDDQAHDLGEDARTGAPWFERVEELLSPLIALEGSVFYRTLRGCRLGLIFESPQDIDQGLAIRRELFARIREALEPMDDAGPDRQALDLARGFAAPMITKRGRARITAEQAQLKISDRDAPQSLLDDLASAWAEREKARAQKASGGSRRSGARGAKNQKSPTERSGSDDRPRVFIGADLGEIEDPHSLARAAELKFASWCHHEGLRREFCALMDRYLQEGRRVEKEAGFYDRRVRELATLAPIDHGASSNAPSIPEPVEVGGGLNPMAREMRRGDDLELAQLVLACFAREDLPEPIWHGAGLRHYSPERGVWDYWGPREIKRLVTLAEGAVVIKGEKATPFSVSQARVEAVYKLLSTLIGSDDLSPFDIAPAGFVTRRPSGDLVYLQAGEHGIEALSAGPEHYATHSLDITLPEQVLLWFQDDEDPRARRAPEPRVFVERFLKRSLNDREGGQDPEEIRAKIETIGEWLGLALLGDCTRQALALVLHGEGSNGKSVLTRLIELIFGEDRCAHLAPQQMGERFARAQLFGAVVNVVSEMPETDLLSSDTIKALISGDSVEVERKHQDPFKLRPRAAHVFACNSLPASRDRSHGLWRRLIPVEFVRVFGRADRDQTLIDDLRAEIPEIVLFALCSAHEYLQAGGLRHEERVNRWRWAWRQETDPIAAFSSEELEEGGETSINDVFERYKLWSEEQGHGGKMSKLKFSKLLGALPNIERYRSRSRWPLRDKSVINRTLREREEVNQWARKSVS
jgi:P4 family phage/plasmid primase-like protien